MLRSLDSLLQVVTHNGVEVMIMYTCVHDYMRACVKVHASQEFHLDTLSLQETSRCLLPVYPLLHHYAYLHQRLVLNLAMSHRTLCKLLSVLLAIFNNLVSKASVHKMQVYVLSIVIDPGTGESCT